MWAVGGMEVLIQNRSQLHFVHHKPGIEPDISCTDSLETAC
jgi:hypothetical protein